MSLYSIINTLVRFKRFKCGTPYVPTPWLPCHIALASRETGLVAEQAEQKRSQSTSTQPQGDRFAIPNRAHPNFTKDAGDLIFSALVALGVRSKTSKFEDLSMFGLINRRSQTFTFPYSSIARAQGSNPCYANVWENANIFRKFWVVFLFGIMNTSHWHRDLRCVWTRSLLLFQGAWTSPQGPLW